MSGPTPATYEIRLGGWPRQAEIASAEGAREAIELWLYAVDRFDFDDIRNSNPRDRFKGIDNRRAVLTALGEWAWEQGTIHPAPGYTELALRSGVNQGRVSKHLAAEVKLQRFVRLVRQGNKGNPANVNRRAGEFHVLTDNPLVRANSEGEQLAQFRANVRAKLRANPRAITTQASVQPSTTVVQPLRRETREAVGAVAAREGGAVASSQPVSVPSAPRGSGDVKPAESPALVHNPLSSSSESAPQGGARFSPKGEQLEDCELCRDPDYFHPRGSCPPTDEQWAGYQSSVKTHRGTSVALGDRSDPPPICEVCHQRMRWFGDKGVNAHWECPNDEILPTTPEDEAERHRKLGLIK